MVGWNQNHELKNICCWVQIIRGSLDKFVPSYCTEDLASRLRTVQVDVLDGLGHLPYLEDPIRFNDSLQRFLRAHAGL
ncbi:pimeloyl-ACP methyl ester carboxylesterase [Paraburkholderia sp. GAS334]